MCIFVESLPKETKRERKFRIILTDGEATLQHLRGLAQPSIDFNTPFSCDIFGFLSTSDDFDFFLPFDSPAGEKPDSSSLMNYFF